MFFFNILEHNNPAHIILNVILGVNVALGKPAQQSTVFGNFDAYLAVDGDATNKAQMDQNSCIHTSDAPGTTQAWWRVNLGQFYTVTMISITTRNWPNGWTGSGW